MILAMKPCDGTFAKNAERHGVAGLNVDGGRIAMSASDAAAIENMGGYARPGYDGDAIRTVKYASRSPAKDPQAHPSGRWPANLLLDEEAAALLDAQAGPQSSGGTPPRRFSDKTRNTFGTYSGEENPNGIGGSSGNVSRFFYTAKVSSAERGESDHPTMKPVDLTAYLAKLLLPPERETPRRLLNPFAGSGSEAVGALRAGWEEVVSIEREDNYADHAEIRIRDDAPLLNTVEVLK